MQSVARVRTRFGRTQRRTCGFKVKSGPGLRVHQAGRAAESGDEARQVFGDGMQGSVRRVKQGDLPVIRRAFSLGCQTKNRAGRSQSVHRSVEAGQCPWSKGTKGGG
jgi:hypothetical protein